MHSDATLHMLMQSVKLRIMKLPPPGPSSAWSLGHITPATVSQTSGDGEGGGGVIGKGEGGVKHSMQPAQLNQAHLSAQGLELKLHMPLHAGGGRDGGGGSGGDGGGGSSEGGVRHSTQPVHMPLAQAHLFAQGLVFLKQRGLHAGGGGGGGGGGGRDGDGGGGGGDGGGGRGEGGVRHSTQPVHMPLAQAHLFAQGLVFLKQRGLHAGGGGGGGGGGGRDGDGGGGGGGGGGGSGEGGVRHSTQPAHAPLTQAHLTAQGLVFKSHTVLQVASGGDGGGGDGSRGSYTPPYIYSP